LQGWFSPVSSTNKTDRHDIAELMFKVALNAINQAKAGFAVIISQISQINCTNQFNERSIYRSGLQFNM
jgi:hypothetical protein